jgi:Type II secretion system (T2SS), protein E, N-terminal domain
MPRLGELLLGEKLIQPAQLEEALETQVIHGGRLGTNLVELGFLKEVDLARVLGRQHNLPYASGEMLPDPSALGVAPRQFFDDADVIPMRIEATRLTVAILHPNQVKALDELAFKVGKRVVSVIIPEFRMNQLLRVHCKAFRPMRPIDMNTLRPSKKQDERTPSPGEVAELINEDDFAKIYADAQGGAEEEVIEGAVIEEEAPIVVGGLSVETQAPPLTFAEAQKQLQTVSGREDIARTVLQFARSKFRRSLILNVQGELVTGWRGMGKGISARAVGRIGVSLREANTFKLVNDLKSHFIGPMKQTPGMEVFYKLLNGGSPKTAVILPLLVRGKLVHLLYLDHGPDQFTPPDIGELLILSQSVTRSYETLIRQRKSAAQH